MPYELAFVDRIASSTSTRLDLHTTGSGWQTLADGTEFSSPPFDRVVAESMMADGAAVPAAVYRNRSINLELELSMSLTPDAQATLVQSLMRELDRPDGNFIRYRSDTTGALFFKTFRSGPNALEWDPFKRRASITLLADPFAYGVEEVLSNVTVTNNPAAAVAGQFFDITSPKGDVDAPLILKLANGTGLGGTGRLRSAISVRKRGTPSATPFFLQAESMTMGTDTTVQVTSATMSGTTNNYVRTTPGTTAMTQRLSTATRFPSAASVDVRGTYRVFARVKLSVASDVWDLRLQWGTGTSQIVGDTVRMPNPWVASSIFYVELTSDQKLLQMPVGFDPVYHSVSGAELAVEGVFLSYQAQRVSGSGSLDTDVLLFVPADDGLTFVKWPTVQAFSTDTFTLLGGERPAAYCLNTSGQISSTEPIEISGGGTFITPGRANRVFFFRDLGTGTATAASSAGDSVTATTVVTPSYFPRYVTQVKPAAT
jgi:hypothetical protein